MSIAAGALGLLGGAAGRAQAQSVALSVDATMPGAPIPRIWDFHGFDEVNYSTSSEGRALLDTLGQIDPTPPHVRMHFLLNTGNGTPALKWGSTNVYTEDAAGNPVYSWTITDQIMDAVTGAGGLSFTEIAFMPQALSPHSTPYQNTSTYASDSGSFYPPTDYAKWGDLIRTWAGHLNGRYPAAAESWLWELWNEPDLSYFHGTAAEYEKLYDYTEAALHQAVPTAKLGGPAVASAGSSLLSSFLQHCANGTNGVTGKTGTRLDLVSFHAKGGAAIVSGHVEMNMGHQLSLHRTGFSAVAAVPAFKQLPIYVSEADPDGCAACPVSSTPADAYRLSPAYGAYVMEMSKRTLDLASSMGVNVGGLITWAFTFPGTSFFAGYRALGTNGIELPVLGAFRLLGGLNGARLPFTSSGAATLGSILANSVRGASDVDGMATLDGDKVQILVWNYHDDLVAATPATVNLTVKVPASFGPLVTISHLRVDEQHGDAYTVWTSQGSPATPSAAQIQAMQAGMLPAALGAPQSVPMVGGTATVSFTLPRSGMSLLTLSSSAAAVDGGVSGGAGRASTPGSAGTGGVGGSSPIGSGSGGVAVSGGGGSGGPSASGPGGAAGTGGLTGSGNSSHDASTGPGESGGGCSCAVGAGADRWAMVLGFALVSIAAFASKGVSRRRRRVAAKVTGRDLPVRVSPRLPGDPPSLVADGARARTQPARSV